MFSFRSKIDSNLKYYMENKVYRKYRVLIKCKNFTKEIAKKILNRDVSKVATMKGIYVATQSNIIRNQKELMLYKIQNRRKTFSTELEIINEELKKNEIDFSVELNRLKEQIHGK